MGDETQGRTTRRRSVAGVDDAEAETPVAADLGVGGVVERHEEVLVGFDEVAVEDLDGDGRLGLARREGDGARRWGVVVAGVGLVRGAPGDVEGVPLGGDGLGRRRSTG